MMNLIPMSELPDLELKKLFVNRQKRLYTNLLRQMKVANEKGILSNEELEQFKSSQNEIVFDDAKKSYIEYKLHHRRKYVDDLFSPEI